MHGHNKPHQTNMTMVRQCFGDNTWVGAAFYRGFLGCCTPFFMFLYVSHVFLMFLCTCVVSGEAFHRHCKRSKSPHRHHIDIVGTGHLKEGYREGFQLASGCQLTEDHSMDTFLYDMLPLVILMHNQREWGFHMFSCLEVKLWNLYWCASTISLGPTPQKTAQRYPTERRFIRGCTAAGATKSGGLCEELDSDTVFTEYLKKSLGGLG